MKTIFCFLISIFFMPYEFDEGVVAGKIRTEKSKPLNFCSNEKDKKKIFASL
jgi:hypothetical protein